MAHIWRYELTESASSDDYDWIASSQDVGYDVSTPRLSQLPATQFTRKRPLTQACTQNKRSRLGIARQILFDAKYKFLCA